MEYVKIPFMPENPMLAHSYVPYQMWSDDLYDLKTGLERGTIFPALDQPMYMYEWEGEK